MAPKISRKSQARFKRVVESLETISKLTNRLNLDDLQELIRRSDIVVEFSSVSRGSMSLSRPGGSPSRQSPVERTVIARVEGRQIEDPVRDKVREIEKLIIEAEGALRKVFLNIEFLNNPVEKKRTRPVSTPCEVCLILPVVRTAMCVTCYQEWVDNGSPDRQRWVAFKRQLTSSEGVILIESQPQPRPGIANT
jgi:hypothetical protein